MKFLLASILVIFTGQAFAENWSFQADGVTFEFGDDGEIERIYAKHTEPVNFPDRRGISTATTIAEERAKARIVRFIEESVTDEMTVYELEVEAQIALASSQASDGESNPSPEVNRENVRASLRSIERMTRSAAEGQLRGVVRLEQDYNAEEEAVYVVVGISRNSTSASRGLRDFLEGSSVQAGDDENMEESALSQDSENKKIADEDW